MLAIRTKLPGAANDTALPAAASAANSRSIRPRPDHQLKPAPSSKANKKGSAMGSVVPATARVSPAKTIKRPQLWWPARRACW